MELANPSSHHIGQIIPSTTQIQMAYYKPGPFGHWHSTSKIISKTKSYRISITTMHIPPKKFGFLVIFLTVHQWFACPRFTYCYKDGHLDRKELMNDPSKGRKMGLKKKQVKNGARRCF